MDRCRKLFNYSVNPLQNISKFKHRQLQVWPCRGFGISLFIVWNYYWYCPVCLYKWTYCPHLLVVFELIQILHNQLRGPRASDQMLLMVYSYKIWNILKVCWTNHQPCVLMISAPVWRPGQGILRTGLRSYLATISGGFRYQDIYNQHVILTAPGLFAISTS